MVSVVLDGRVPARAMIDTGSDFDLLDPAFAKDHNIPVLQLQNPIQVQSFDGEAPSSGPISSCTPEMSINYRDDITPIRFHVNRLAGYDAILGLPWLYRVLPVIDFRNASVYPASELALRGEPVRCETIDHDELVREAAAGERVCALYISPTGALSESPWPPRAPTAPVVASASADATEAVPAPPVYREFFDLFSKDKADLLPEHSEFDHSIPLQDGREPPFGPLYGMNPAELKALREYLDENLARGFIRPSTSPAGSPILFVKKKDGTLRLCVDYRGLNAVTIKDRTPLPLINETLNNLRGAKIFTALDLRGAYNLLRIKEGEEWKTAFRTRYGHFEYLVMPFGLTNAPATFQAMINTVLRPYLDVFCSVYLDDILIYSESEEDHVKHVTTILRALAKHKLYVKAEKCKWHVRDTEFLGYIVTPDGPRMAPDKIQSVQSWPVPRNKKELLSFLGFANYYRLFLPNYSGLARPLYRLCKDVPWEWTEREEKAFQLFKEAFTSAPVLAQFDCERPGIIETDASDNVIAGILSQKGADGLPHPCAYYSRQMTDPETRYDIHDKELLAVMECLDAWRIFLAGRTEETVVLTDHLNLRYFTTKKKLNARQARWAETLSDYNVRIEYRAGVSNVRADAMSRRCDLIDRPPSDLPPPVFPETKHNFTGTIAAVTASGTPRGPPRPAEEEVARILHDAHDSPMAGHGGTRRTLDLVLRKTRWAGVRKDVQKYVQDCEVCARNKVPRTKPYGLLQPLQIAERPWESVTLDYIVKLPPSRGFDSIVVYVDRLTKAAHFRPTREDISANEAVLLFADNVIRLHGVPKEVITDRGSHFKSTHWKQFHESLGTKVKLSSAYHPTTDGQTERTNQTLEKWLRMYISATQDDWAEKLPQAEFCYNNSLNSSTQASPFLLNLGYHPSPDGARVNNDLWDIAGLQKEARRLLEIARTDMARYANRKRQPAPFKEGDWVYLSTRHLGIVQATPKLGPKYVGPYRITKDFKNSSFQLDTPGLQRHNVYHASLLKPSHAPPKEPQGPVLVDDEEEYEIEALLAKKSHKNNPAKDKFRVRWKGYGADHDVWYTRDQLEHATELIKDLERKVEAPRPRPKRKVRRP